MKAFWRKLTEKLGQVRGWLRAKVRRSWTAIRQMLIGTTTRAISTLVAVSIIIAIPLLVFDPKWQTAATTLLELGSDSLGMLVQFTGIEITQVSIAVTLVSIAVTIVAVYFAWKQLRSNREGQL